MNRKNLSCLIMKIKIYGFTLVELMIAVTIIGILASISYPMYTANTREAKRADAKGALVSLANALEQWKMQKANPNDPNDGGYLNATLGASGIFPDTVPLSGGKQTYSLRIDELTISSYKLIATPIESDSELSLDNMGVKTCTSSLAKDSNWCINDTW